MLAGMQAQRRQQGLLPGRAGCMVLLRIRGLMLSGAELLGVAGAGRKDQPRQPPPGHGRAAA